MRPSARDHLRARGGLVDYAHVAGLWSVASLRVGNTLFESGVYPQNEAHSAKPWLR